MKNEISKCRLGGLVGLDGSSLIAWAFASSDASPGADDSDSDITY